MWQWMGVIALDIANEKSREAQAAADRWLADARERRDDDCRAAPGAPRRMAAGALRRLSDASISIGEAACEAATRLDHRTA